VKASRLREDVGQPLAPALQRGIDHVERGDGQKVSIERDYGRAPEALVPAEQDGGRDERAGLPDRLGHVAEGPQVRDRVSPAPGAFRVPFKAPL
jgi:hypothetical protein